MAIDPICGMKVDEKKAEKKELVVNAEKNTYFCSKQCMEKYLKKEIELWYQSKTFGKVFPWILAVVLLGGTAWAIISNFMILYMGIFFIVFSLMKMLDWKGFVTAFSQYDLIAKRVKFYGVIYPGIEFGLGILFLIGHYSTNAVIPVVAWITIFIMGIGAIGVGKNLLSKDKVRCACLGTKINVPLTKVTFLEDILMVVMAIMLISGFS